MKEISFAVTQPCPENWEAMTPEQRGRFCALCNKTVVDFSNMSDRQLTQFFSVKRNNLCGRFHTSQLNREMVMPPQSGFWLRPFIPLALTALTVLFTACSPENKLQEEMGLSEDQPAAKVMSETQWFIVPDSSIKKSAKTTTHEFKEEQVQVVTKKNKTVHPAFHPVDTLRLPAVDTPARPSQAVDTMHKPLLKPRKETFIMGRVSYTHYKAMEERRKKEQGGKQIGVQPAGEQH